MSSMTFRGSLIPSRGFESRRAHRKFEPSQDTRQTVRDPLSAIFFALGRHQNAVGGLW